MHGSMKSSRCWLPKNPPPEFAGDLPRRQSPGFAVPGYRTLVHSSPAKRRRHEAVIPKTVHSHAFPPPKHRACRTVLGERRKFSSTGEWVRFEAAKAKTCHCGNLPQRGGIPSGLVGPSIPTGLSTTAKGWLHGLPWVSGPEKPQPQRGCVRLRSDDARCA